jgi:hypothetical protein
MLTNLYSKNKNLLGTFCSLGTILFIKVEDGIF